MSTAKLYWELPFALTFEAEAATWTMYGDRRAVVLPSTLFYPEGGGQLGDTGVLKMGAREVRIVDTQIDEAGTIFHLVDGEPAEGDGAVTGIVDQARRLDHMAQHTAQHMLSCALVDVAKAPTVSARLGLASCTLDVDRGSLTDAQLLGAEDLVNDVIRSDVAVRAFFPTPEELGKLDLRRAPKVDSGVRIVEIEGFDLTPCGGTHCTRTGQIGVLRIAGTERYKGKTRVSFHAAKRALVDARAKEHALLELAKMFSCGALDVGQAAERLRADLKDRTDALGRARGELTTHVADGLLAAHAPDASGTTVLFLEREDDLGTLRTLAGRLTARPDVVAICVSPDAATGDWLVVAQRGAAASFDCGAWLKAKAEAHGGRGGGRPERAEGRLPKGTTVP